jgi:AraC-like DNA-binding protein
MNDKSRVTGSIHFEGQDVAETEKVLHRLYQRTHIRPQGAASSARITRNWLGSITIDDLAFDYTMDYDAPAMGRICIRRVHRGSITTQAPCLPTEVSSPGDVTVYPPSAATHSGQVCNAVFDMTMFDSAQLNRVAATGHATSGERVRLKSHRPVSEQAGRRLSSYIDYLRGHVLSEPDVRNSPLVISAAVQGLAATVLTVLPNTAVLEPTYIDRNDNRATIFRRAVEFVEENADRDIALADIATAARVTPRAIQYMFRDRLQLTPLQFLTRTRLEHVHQELRNGDPSVTTVGAIARKWGFGNYSTFVARYREAYRCSPGDTLRGPRT